ncbi:TolB family protein [Mycetocola zhadangensis]|nr:PD40 domain-containing protein [Mycetocola zhadangensis]GGE97679.1 hypothetical protein GCM10011313_20910 [Mycetocola zhadangensis]
MRRARRIGIALTAAAIVVCGSGCSTATDAASAQLCDEPSSTPTVEDPSTRPLAFSSNRADSFDLWLMGADGTDPVQLTTADGVEGMASWSPDGTQLLFLSAVDTESNGDVCVINADGTGLKNLTSTPDVYETTPSWSPDGSEIVYGTWKGKAHELHVMDSTGKRSHRITSNGNWPSWSPDGELIVFSASRGSSAQDLWTVNRDGSDKALLADGDSELTEPAWSPDGRTIAYVSVGSEETEEDIFIMPAGGGSDRRVAALPGNDHWPPAWSPDSMQLAFTADGTDLVGEIVVVDLRTRETTNLTNHESHDAFPAWRQ